MSLSRGFELKCFKDGIPHRRDYPGATYQQAMTVALRSGERWDFVETLSGNIRRYRDESGQPTPKLFGTLAAAIDEDVQRRERAQARLDAPRIAPKITAEPQGPNNSEQGHAAMIEHRPPRESRRMLREGLPRAAWFFPQQFRKKIVGEVFLKHFEQRHTESSINNFVDECVREGIFIRVRTAWYTLREGFAVPPPEQKKQEAATPVSTPPPALPSFTHPMQGANPLDALFHKPFASKQVAANGQTATVANGADTTPSVAPAPQVNVQSSMLSMMVLADLVATDTTGHELLLLEMSEGMSTMQKLLDRCASMVAQYEKAQQARNQLLALLGKEQPKPAAAQQGPPPSTIPAPSDKTTAAH